MIDDKERDKGKSKSITEIINEVCEDICNNYCKYSDTCDDNFECEAIREKGECPLDRLL